MKSEKNPIFFTNFWRFFAHKERKVEGIRYEARIRGRSPPDSLAFWACETPSSQGLLQNDISIRLLKNVSYTVFSKLMTWLRNRPSNLLLVCQVFKTCSGTCLFKTCSGTCLFKTCSGTCDTGVCAVLHHLVPPRTGGANSRSGRFPSSPSLSPVYPYISYIHTAAWLQFYASNLHTSILW